MTKAHIDLSYKTLKARMDHSQIIMDRLKEVLLTAQVMPDHIIATPLTLHLDQLSEEFGMPCTAIVQVQQVLQHLHNREINGEVHIDDELRDRMLEYLAEYGPKDHAV